MFFTTAVIVGAISVLGVIAILSLDRIKSWLRGRNATRTGELIKENLANGNVAIISIGLGASGNETARKTWTAKSLDPDLAAAFGYSNRVRITL
jgi:hypothetical protein